MKKTLVLILISLFISCFLPVFAEEEKDDVIPPHELVKMQEESDTALIPVIVSIDIKKSNISYQDLKETARFFTSIVYDKNQLAVGEVTYKLVDGNKKFVSSKQYSAYSGQLAKAIETYSNNDIFIIRDRSDSYLAVLDETGAIVYPAQVSGTTSTRGVNYEFEDFLDAAIYKNGIEINPDLMGGTPPITDYIGLKVEKNQIPIFIGSVVITAVALSVVAVIVINKQRKNR